MSIHRYTYNRRRLSKGKRTESFEGEKQILLMFEQIIAFTLHLSISMREWAGHGMGLSLWCRKYERVLSGWERRGRGKECSFQPLSLLCVRSKAIKDVNLTLIRRTIFQSIWEVNGINMKPSHQPSHPTNHSNSIRWKRSGRWWNEIHSFAIECSMIRKEED